jgi:hypothetical protein
MVSESGSNFAVYLQILLALQPEGSSKIDIL